MNNLREEVMLAVDKINDDLYQKFKKRNELEYLPVVHADIGGEYITISISIPDDCCGIELTLFANWNDDRIYYEKSDRYETILHLIKRKFLEIKDRINNIKL